MHVLSSCKLLCKAAIGWKYDWPTCAIGPACGLTKWRRREHYSRHVACACCYLEAPTRAATPRTRPPSSPRAAHRQGHAGAQAPLSAGSPCSPRLPHGAAAGQWARARLLDRLGRLHGHGGLLDHDLAGGGHGGDHARRALPVRQVGRLAGAHAARLGRRVHAARGGGAAQGPARSPRGAGGRACAAWGRRAGRGQGRAPPCSPCLCSA